MTCRPNLTLKSKGFYLFVYAWILNVYTVYLKLYSEIFIFYYLCFTLNKEILIRDVSAPFQTVVLSYWIALRSKCFCGSPWHAQTSNGQLQLLLLTQELHCLHDDQKQDTLRQKLTAHKRTLLKHTHKVYTHDQNMQTYQFHRKI